MKTKRDNECFYAGWGDQITLEFDLLMLLPWITAPGLFCCRKLRVLVGSAEVGDPLCFRVLVLHWKSHWVEASRFQLWNSPDKRKKFVNQHRELCQAFLWQLHVGGWFLLWNWTSPAGSPFVVVSLLSGEVNSIAKCFVFWMLNLSNEKIGKILK